MAHLAELVEDLEDVDGVMSNENVELGPVFFDKKEYIVTKNGNKISKKALLAGSQKIQSNVQLIIENGVIIRGDYAPIAIGKTVVLGESSVIRPPDQLLKGQIVFVKVTIGNHVVIESNSLVEAASIGNYVHIGKNCIIGARAIIKDCVRILDNTVIAPNTVVAPFSVYGGSPGRFIKRLPESFQETWTNHTISYFHSFIPRPEARGNAVSPREGSIIASPRNAAAAKPSSPNPAQSPTNQQAALLQVQAQARAAQAAKTPRK